MVKITENLQNINHAITNTINSAPWRYSVGRASHAVRIPIYLVASTFQLAKACVKMLPAFVLLACEDENATVHENDDHWLGINGVGRDFSALASLAEDCGKSIAAVFLAPEEEYSSLISATASCFKTVVMGDYHTEYRAEHYYDYLGRTPVQWGQRREECNTPNLISKPKAHFS